MIGSDSFSRLVMGPECRGGSIGTATDQSCQLPGNQSRHTLPGMQICHRVCESHSSFLFATLKVCRLYMLPLSWKLRVNSLFREIICASPAAKQLFTTPKKRGINILPCHAFAQTQKRLVGRSLPRRTLVIPSWC